MKKDTIGTIIKFALILILIVIPMEAFCFQSDLQPDTENCLLCHRYPTLGRYDKSGTKRVFYINDDEYANSIHGRLKCTNCHVGLDSIPHTDIKKVDCSTNCHLSEPSTDRDFSHSNMIKDYENSVHGKMENGVEKAFSEDLPTCKYCHKNQTMKYSGELFDKSDALMEETITRCTGCHTEQEWTRKFFAHMTHRMRRIRESSDIVSLCISCHEDSAMMARHEIETVGNYKDTFHWILLKYGVDDAPDCMDCHIPKGHSTHQISRETDIVSPIHKENRVQTCSNQNGVKSCHPDAKSKFAEGTVHHYGDKAQLTYAKNKVSEDGVEGASSGTMQESLSMTTDEFFQAQVIAWLELFYKILIAVVIGFMTLHQLMDYIRTKIRFRNFSNLDQEA